MVRINTIPRRSHERRDHVVTGTISATAQARALEERGHVSSAVTGLQTSPEQGRQAARDYTPSTGLASSLPTPAGSRLSRGPEVVNSTSGGVPGHAAAVDLDDYLDLDQERLAAMEMDAHVTEMAAIALRLPRGRTLDQATSRASREYAARIGGQRDEESVMQRELQTQTDTAAAGLYARFPTRGCTRTALQEIKEYLLDLQAGKQSKPDGFFLTVRGGDLEINHALRAFDGPAREDDCGEAVADAPDMARLCALVWHAAGASRDGVSQAQAGRDRELMRHGFVLALAHCIEDDGHRVCPVGQRQFLIDSLKGWYPEAGDAQGSVTARALLSVMAEEFYKNHAQPQPARDAIEAFEAHARAVAGERFGEGTAALAEFSQHLREYLDMTYGGDLDEASRE